MTNKHYISYLLICIMLLAAGSLTAQTSTTTGDSLSAADLAKLPAKYVATIADKADKYYNAVTGKTEKTLERLAKWESKIKAILEKASPETAQRLFGNDQLTFASLLEKYKQGKVAADNYRGQYNEYRDKVNTTVKYLDDKKQQLNTSVIKPLQDAKAKTTKLDEQLKNTEAVQQFIKERKKQLMDQALQYLGKSKYLQKISKESYYYVETLRNYKEIFNDPKKAEELAVKLLNKIPGFSEFINQTGAFAGLFGSGVASPVSGNINYAALGYQSNAAVALQIQQRGVGSSGSIQSLTQSGGSTLNSPLEQLKNRFSSIDNTDDMPSFKPNEMKSKTLRQRIKLGGNFQFGKAQNFLPGTADVGVQLAYLLNSRSSVGIGSSYKIGLGTGWRNIKFSSEGIGMRSFIDWRIKGNIFLNGGFEYNYYQSFSNLRSLPSFNGQSISLWKPAALIGLSKKYNIGKMKGNMLLLYDFFGKQKTPATQTIIIRFGYNF